MLLQCLHIFQHPALLLTVTCLCGLNRNMTVPDLKKYGSMKNNTSFKNIVKILCRHFSNITESGEDKKGGNNAKLVNKCVCVCASIKRYRGGEK